MSAPSPEPASPHLAAPRGVPGWVVVSFVIVVSLGLAGLALGYHLFQSSRLISYFGVPALGTIRDANEATLYVPLDGENGDVAGAIEIDGKAWRPFAPGRNEAARPGWTHAKSAFLAAESYRWDEFPPAASLAPDAMLRFEVSGKPTGPVDILLDWDAAAISIGSDRGLTMSDQKRDALKTYLLEPPGDSP